MRKPPLFGLTYQAQKVTVRLVHAPNGAAKMQVRAGNQSRTVNYRFNSRDPFLTALLEAFEGTNVHILDSEDFGKRKAYWINKEAGK